MRISLFLSNSLPLLSLSFIRRHRTVRFLHLSRPFWRSTPARLSSIHVDVARRVIRNRCLFYETFYLAAQPAFQYFARFSRLVHDLPLRSVVFSVCAVISSRFVAPAIFSLLLLPLSLSFSSVPFGYVFRFDYLLANDTYSLSQWFRNASRRRVHFVPRGKRVREIVSLPLPRTNDRGNEFSPYRRKFPFADEASERTLKVNAPLGT